MREGPPIRPCESGGPRSVSGASRRRVSLAGGDSRERPLRPFGDSVDRDDAGRLGRLLLRQGHHEDAVLVARPDLVLVHVVRKPERPPELAVTPLEVADAGLIAVAFGLALPADRQGAVLDANLDVLLGKARQVAREDVRLVGLGNVDGGLPSPRLVGHTEEPVEVPPGIECVVTHQGHGCVSFCQHAADILSIGFPDRMSSRSIKKYESITIKLY